MNKIGKEQILQNATLMFTRFGLKVITVNDICHSMGISKKTFYLFYTNKDQIIKEFVETSFIIKYETLSGSISENNILDVFKEFDLNLVKVLKNFYPQMVFDLVRYYETAYITFTQKRADLIKDLAVIIEQGKQQEVFRANIDSQIIAELRFIELESIFSMILESKSVPLHAKQQEYYEHYLAGLLSVTKLALNSQTC